MVRGVYAARFCAIYSGEHPIEKYWTLRQRALVLGLPGQPVEVSGPDTVPFLEKALARRIATMRRGRGYYAIACTPQGGIFMDRVVSRLGGGRFWYAQADRPFETWLIAHSGGFDATISRCGIIC